MRITSGVFRGRLLKVPKGVRPTQDRVRKALFDVLGKDVPGRRVLDLFAGSGALGAEALSREAASALFVDEDAGAVRAIRDNLAALGLAEQDRRNRQVAKSAKAQEEMESHSDFPWRLGGERVFVAGGRVAEVWRSGYREALRRLRLAGRTFDLVLMDPPYGEGLLLEALQGLAGAEAVASGGLVVAEADARLPTPEAAGLTPLDERVYGGTKLMFWMRTSP